MDGFGGYNMLAHVVDIEYNMQTGPGTNCLKELAQAKIIKKSVILFRVLNMTI